MKHSLRILLLCSLELSAFGATFNSDGSPSDVQTKLGLCSAGDTVTLPAGTFPWTSNIIATIPANITLVGAGTSATGGGDQTIIVDNLAADDPLIDIVVPTSGVFRFTGITIRGGTGALKESEGVVRFRTASGIGTIRVDHSKFDQHTYSVLSPQHSPVFAGLKGVVDHCIINYVSNGSTHVFGNTDQAWAEDTAFGTADFLYFEDCEIYGGEGSLSSGSYPSRMWDIEAGAKTVLRFSTLYFCSGGETHATGHAANDRGGRATETYGNLYAKAVNQDATGRTPRSMVDIQSGSGLVWGNTINTGAIQSFVTMSTTRRNSATYFQTPNPIGFGYVGPYPTATGTVSVSGTTVTKTGGTNFDPTWPAGTMIYIVGGSQTSVSSITRSSDTATATTASPHGWATGDLVKITGATGGDGAYYNVESRAITVTGSSTFTYAMNGTPSASAAGTLFAGINLKTIAFGGQEPGAGASGGISSVNSTTSITLTAAHTGTAFTGATYYVGSAWDGNTDAYGYPALDQTGRGRGYLLTGVHPNKVIGAGQPGAGTIAWPNQVLEPVYIWKNSGTPEVTAYSNGSTNLIQADRDYYEQSSGIQTSPGDLLGTPGSPFNGLTGTGWGTFANRPPRCEPGVAYWAIDQGSWNQSASNPHGVNQAGAQGRLYIATGVNTWGTVAPYVYEPYTYPHPLQNTTQVAAPIFSPIPGTYASAQSITITSATGGATIRYTTNGTTPSNSVGTIYSVPVSISTSATLKAIAYDGVLTDSAVTTGGYVISAGGDAVVTGTTTVTTQLTLP